MITENSVDSEDHFQPIATFILKTYAILASPQNAQVIEWKSDGRSFVIKNLTKFTQSVLPQQFRHHKYESFIRQLNMYSFYKVKSIQGPCFTNPYFQKGRESLLKFIKRKPEKKKKKSVLFEELSDKENSLKSLKMINDDSYQPIKTSHKVDSGSILLGKQEQPVLRTTKKVGFVDEVKEENEQNLSTLIEPSYKWLNSKEECCWQNMKSFSSFRISLKLLSFEEEPGQEEIDDEVKQEQGSEVVTLKNLEIN